MRISELTSGRPAAGPPGPVDHAAFLPGPQALPAPEFATAFVTEATRLEVRPTLETPVLEGRDARVFPAVRFEVFTLTGRLVPVERGRMIRPRAGESPASYWCLIPQIGRVWRDACDGGWSRAALPVMLVNDTENHAHQGVILFAYRDGEVSGLFAQFMQQTAAYRLRPHFIAWGWIGYRAEPTGHELLAVHRAHARSELEGRLTAAPSEELGAREDSLSDGKSTDASSEAAPEHRVQDQWVVQRALVRNRILHYGESPTEVGPYPYPLEMRFGVRSVMKSIGAPLALLRLAQTDGPSVLTLRVGDYVSGLDPKWSQIRFVDAANMATGFGGTGSLETAPNDILDGYLGGDYEAWFVAGSHEEKLAHINASLRPYPWKPGSVMRYRDQDFYLLGAALDGYLKRRRGPQADLWEVLGSEVFAPIGIRQAPAVRTRDGARGLIWLNAGYYPTLDDLAKIALLYLDRGAYSGEQILHRGLTESLLAARDAIPKTRRAVVASPGDPIAARIEPLAALPEPTAPPPEPHSPQTELYQWGFHYLPYFGGSPRRWHRLPLMWGAGGSHVVLYPNGTASIVISKAPHPFAGSVSDSYAQRTVRAIDRLAPF